MSDPSHLPSLSRVTPEEIARRNFPTQRRGFDVAAVRAYLEDVAHELAGLEDRERELHEALAAAEDRALHPVIDPSTITAALGQQSAQILRNAHEEAARITEAADMSANALLREAHSQASEIRVQAEAGAAERVAEAELSVGSVHEGADRDASEVVATARREAEEFLIEARKEGQALIDQAQESRRRILADMARRRQAMTLQFEQIRAARDELASSVVGLRQSVDQAVVDLSLADDRARAAAADVARRGPSGHPTSISAALPASTGYVPTPAPSSASSSAPSTSLSASATPSGSSPSVTESTSQSGADDAVADGGGDPEAGGDAEGASDVVEGLFARLRAGHDDEDGAEAGDVPVASENGAEAADGPSPETDEESVAPEDPAVARRNELLDPVVGQITRRVKRALQDDQNYLLDRLRGESHGWSPALLDPEADQRARYVEAAMEGMIGATGAGVSFAREHGGRSRAKGLPASATTAANAAADVLAASIVMLIRRRLGEGTPAFGHDSGGSKDHIDPAAGVDLVGAAYREWRGERIERLVGDHALEAFSAGVVAALGQSQGSGATLGLRWVTAGPASPCADCDDNSLAGTVAPGEEFPTGHLHPPAHAGCRCAAVPTPA